MDLTLSTRQVGDVTILDLSGRIVLGEESAKLRSVIGDLLREGHVKILLNLADVNYIDSSGLGNLVSTYATVKKSSGELKLLKLTAKVQDVMQITKLYTIFDIKEDEASAIKAFGQTAAAGA
jgi:anti-sigma B factor antagonist